MIRNIALLLSTLLYVVSVHAEYGRTSPATPTLINTIRSEGFIVYGAFGNPGACTRINSIWIPRNHAEYDKLYSTALAAFMGGKKLDAFIHSCIDIPWLSGVTQTYNQLTVGDFRITH